MGTYFPASMVLDIVFCWQLFRWELKCRSNKRRHLIASLHLSWLKGQKRRHIAHLSGKLLVLAQSDPASSWSGSMQVMRESSKPRKILKKDIGGQSLPCISYSKAQREKKAQCHIYLHSNAFLPPPPPFQFPAACYFLILVFCWKGVLLQALSLLRSLSKHGNSNGNDIEAKRNEASILRHFLYRSKTNKLILKLWRIQNLVYSLQDRRENELG